MRHMAWTSNRNKECSSFRHTTTDDVPGVFIDRFRWHVTNDDDIKLAPLLLADRKLGGLRITELARRRGGNRAHRLSEDRIGLEEDILQVDRFIPSVKQIAQVAKFPAGM